jgi:hypothetical protein
VGFLHPELGEGRYRIQSVATSLRDSRKIAKITLKTAKTPISKSKNSSALSYITIIALGK